MSRNILLIDDKEDFKVDFQGIAQRKDFAVAWGRSHEELVEKLPEMHLIVAAIILDIKCLMSNEQEIERPDFIGSALTYLDREFPDIPRMILTGDEKALEMVQSIHQNDEDIYKKEPEELERLFVKLEEHVKNHPQRILTYQEKEIIDIIASGEGKHLEYKSSLQYCTKTKKENRELRFEVLKNIAAFANTNGGDLLIGVDDNQNILGLESTDFLTLKDGNKIDLYRLMFDDLIQTSFGNDFHKNLEDFRFYDCKGKSVCRIAIKGKNHNPVYIKKTSKDSTSYGAFFIRAQASARELKGDELAAYLQANW